MLVDHTSLQGTLVAFGLTYEGGIELVNSYVDYESILIVNLRNPMRTDKDAERYNRKFCEHIIDNKLFDFIPCENAFSESGEDLRNYFKPDPKNSKFMVLEDTFSRVSNYASRSRIPIVGNLFLNLKTKIPVSISNANLKTYMCLTSNPAKLNCYVIGDDAATKWSNILGSGMHGLRRLISDIYGILYDETTIAAPLPFIVFECKTLYDYLNINFSNDYKGALERFCYGQCLSAIYNLMNSKLQLHVPLANFKDGGSRRTLAIVDHPKDLRGQPPYKKHMYRSLLYNGSREKEGSTITYCPYDMYSLWLFLLKSGNIRKAIYSKPNWSSEISEQSSDFDIDNYPFNPECYDTETPSQFDYLGITAVSHRVYWSGFTFPPLWFDKINKKIVLTDGKILYPNVVGPCNNRLPGTFGMGLIQNLVEESTEELLNYTRNRFSSYISSASTWLYKISRDCLEFPTSSEYPKRSEASKHFYNVLNYCQKLSMRDFRALLSTGLYYILNESFHTSLYSLEKSGRADINNFKSLFDILFRSTKPKYHSNVFLHIQKIDTSRIYVADLDHLAMQIVCIDMRHGDKLLTRGDEISSPLFVKLSSMTEQVETIHSLYLRGLKILVESFKKLQSAEESLWLQNFGSVQNVVTRNYDIIDFSDIGYISASESMQGLSIFSSSNVPKHLKKYSNIGSLTIKVKTDPPIDMQGLTVRKYLKVCEILKEYESAIKLVTTIETILHGLLDADTNHANAHYIITLITKLNNYLEVLKDLRDQD